MSFQGCARGCGHSGSSNFGKMTRLHPNNNRIPLFMLETPTAFCVSADSPRRCNCLTSLLLNNLIKQKKKRVSFCQPHKNRAAGVRRVAALTRIPARALERAGLCGNARGSGRAAPFRPTGAYCSADHTAHKAAVPRGGLQLGCELSPI